MFDQPGNLIVADPDNMPKMDEEFLRRLEEEVMKHEKKDSVTTMSDLVHKCVSCQAVAYETSPGYYQCSECDFSWEVVDFGNE